ncbi:MAG: hypothetical protein RBT80_24440, partial [Candidatus Vecturithrix sp.]|nr:hypothetical protein [Candidatus Vecturithrix sp.]
MAKRYDTAAYKKLLLYFMGELAPLYSMLQWLTARMLIDEYEERFPDAMRVLEEGLEDALQFMTF